MTGSNPGRMSEPSGTMVPMVSARGTAGSSYADHIVGRAEQRDQLRRVLDDVIDDGSRFVIVGGDAGPERRP